MAEFWHFTCGHGHAGISKTGRLLPTVELCLGTTKGGHPRHPLYVRGDTAAVDFGGDPR